MYFHAPVQPPLPFWPHHPDIVGHHWGLWNAKQPPGPLGLAFVPLGAGCRPLGGLYGSYAPADHRRAQAPSMDGSRELGGGGGGWALPEEPHAICVVNSLTSGACASLCLEAGTADIVGFDAEWVPDWTWASDNPISVLQLAFPESNRVYVIQLGSLGRQLPQAVQLMLLNPEVTKVGFACSYKDEAKLASSGIVVTKGSMVDVQTRCAALLGMSRMDGRFISLKRAAQELLGFPLDKDKRHSCSDWSREKLTPEQVRYAALDAWVALRLYYRTV